MPIIKENSMNYFFIFINVFLVMGRTLSFQIQQSITSSNSIRCSFQPSVSNAIINYGMSSRAPARHQSHDSVITLFSDNSNNDDEFNIGETYDGDVDWDAEWSKVVKNQDQPTERPGKDFYKNDVEKAIGKTAKAAQEQISKIPKVKVEMPAVSKPNMPASLSGDAKLWLAIIVIISVGSAVIGASGSINADYTNSGVFDI
jgi:hypothetical protein